jgi:hypothetical protein
MPDDTNPAAEQGTACHEAVENWLGEGMLPDVGEVMSNGIKIERDMYIWIEEVCDWIADQGFTQVWIESKVPVGKALGLNDPDIMWGTCDLIALKVDTDGVLEIWFIDYKFGFGPVYAKGNDQVALYMSGGIQWLIDEGHLTLNDIQAAKLIGMIHQPRRDGADFVEVSLDYLEGHKAFAVKAVADALSDDPEFRPGAHCEDKYCKARGSCKAYLNWAIGGDFEVVDAATTTLEADTVLSDIEIGEMLIRLKGAVALHNTLKKEAQSRISIGRDVPGWVLERTNGKSGWIDADDVLEHLEGLGADLDLYAPRKPLGIGVLKKLLGKEAVEALTQKSAGTESLVEARFAKNVISADFEILE